MRNIKLNVAGVIIDIQDDGEQPVPIYNFTLVKPEPAASVEREPDGIVIDRAHGLMWSRDDVVPKSCNQAKVEKACKDLRLGGFDDWRLPTRKELLTLVDDKRYEPAIDTARFPSCKSAYYWTTTPCAWSSVFAWVVNFGNGLAGAALRDANGAFARAVRSVPAGQ